MAQYTNSAAFNQLRPLVNNNLGAIVSEHIRYYQSRKDDKEAQQKALDAQASALNLKRSKAIKDAYEGIAPDENEGFLNSQVVAAWNNKKGYATQLAKRYANGDENAGIELADLTKKFENLSSLSAIYGTKAQEYASDEANYNEWLDKPIKNFTKSTTTGKYIIDKDTLGIKVYDEDTGELRELKNGELRSNAYLTGAYSGKAKFDENGKAIAANLLDNNSGFKQETEQTRKDGIKLVDAVFGSNDIEARSFLARTRQEDVKDKDGKVIKFNDKNGNPIPLGKLNPVQKTKLRSLYYDNYVQPNIVEVTPKPSAPRSTKTVVPALDKINIVTNTLGEPELVPNPNTPEPKKGEPRVSLKTDTYAYSLKDSRIKFGNGTQTIDNLYLNPETGTLSARVSLYDTEFSEPTIEINSIGEPELVDPKPLGKRVQTYVVTGNEEMSRIGNELGVKNAEGLRNLLLAANKKNADEQAAKKNNNNEESQTIQLSDKASTL